MFGITSQKDKPQHVAMATDEGEQGLPVVHLLDYGAGNVRSVRNAIRRVGFAVRDVTCAADIDAAKALVFPGVGAFASAMRVLEERGYTEPLRRYIASDRPFLGICLGLQLLFEESDESEGVRGLGILPGRVARFPAEVGGVKLAVPHIGWNGIVPVKHSVLFPEHAQPGTLHPSHFYFVHSFRIEPSSALAEWVLSTTNYAPGGPCAGAAAGPGAPSVEYVSSVQKGRVHATQFHPEKSGAAGLDLLRNFLAAATADAWPELPVQAAVTPAAGDGGGNAARTALACRVIACLDVRENDAGDLVVTKGDQYDVREEGDVAADADADADAADGFENTGSVRNLGKPVELAERYYDEGADEVVFLNICSFRSEPLADFPLIAVPQQASSRVFVPLTIGGGIRNYTDTDGVAHSACDVATSYFRAGADKVSIGSDAVRAAESYWARLASGDAAGGCDGSSAIEAIAEAYGRQAVVVSIDPKRVYVGNDDEVPAPADAEAGEGTYAAACAAARAAGLPAPTVVSAGKATGPNGETRCWYQATVRGGREGRPIDAVALARM